MAPHHEAERPPEGQRASHLGQLKRLIPRRWRERWALGAALFVLAHIAVPAAIALGAFVALRL
jgi:hypothetical protein